MKKLYIIICLLFILTGCTKIDQTELKNLKSTIDDQNELIEQLSKEVSELANTQSKIVKHLDIPDFNETTSETSTEETSEMEAYSSVEPLFPNSVVSNVIDFILDTDPDSFESLKFIGTDYKEMPDSRNDYLFDSGTFIFEAKFIDGDTLEIWCHSSFGTQEEAFEYAEKLSPRLGKLPSVQRQVLDHVVIHKGDATAFAENSGHFFVLYSDNMDARISTHDLEETVFHESVHAALQEEYENSIEWVKAQTSDGNFITEYAMSLPHLEDMPETALFAYTLITNPGRLPEDIEKWITDNIPNRLSFFEEIYE